MTEDDEKLASMPTKAARRVVALLEDDGHEAFLVGGCVRDALIGRAIADIDVTTSAVPTQVITLAEEHGLAAHPTGIAHGTVTVVVDGEALEVTTYRIDGAYRDGRHPEEVTFTDDIEADLARRDFTINAMAWSPSAEMLVDPFGGRRDLAAHIVRCVGEPERRFSEDALRIMRALRFSAQLGFTLEEKTAQALVASVSLLDAIAVERVAAELLLLVSAPHAAAVIRTYWDVIAHVVPELAPMKGFEQHNPHHPHDVAEHTLVALDSTPSYDPCVRMALLFHDCGKPDTFHLDETGGHFYGHPARSAEITQEALERLRYPRAFSDEVVKLVGRHDAPIMPETKNIKRWMNRLGHDSFYRLLDVKRGDVAGLCADDQPVLALFDEIEAIARRIDDERACFSLKDLAVDGTDIIALGVAPGPEVGQLLGEALDAVIDERIPNEKDALLGFLRTDIDAR